MTFVRRVRRLLSGEVRECTNYIVRTHVLCFGWIGACQVEVEVIGAGEVEVKVG